MFEERSSGIDPSIFQPCLGSTARPRMDHPKISQAFRGSPWAGRLGGKIESGDFFWQGQDVVDREVIPLDLVEAIAAGRRGAVEGRLPVAGETLG